MTEKSGQHDTSSFFRLGVLLCLLALIWLPGDRGLLDAQGTFTGQWTAELRPDLNNDEIRFSIYRRTGYSGTSQSSSIVPFSMFDGLTRRQAMSNGTDVEFRMLRDAGILACEGWFDNGKGSGHFTFEASEEFFEELRRQGYRSISEEEQFQMAVLDVSLGYIEDLKDIGYDSLGIDQLFAMRIHGVSLEFIEALQARGYDRVSADNLVSMRIHGVSPKFISDLRALGYDRVTTDQLISMRIHGVTIDYIERLRARGFDDLTVDDMVSLRIHGIIR